MNKNNNYISSISPIFAKLPEEIQCIIFQYAIITPSASAIKIYLGWYKGFLSWKKDPNCFITYYFYYLKPLDKDLLLSLINYKIPKKRNLLF